MTRKKLTPEQLEAFGAEILALCEVVRDYAGTTLEFIPTVGPILAASASWYSLTHARAN